MSAVLRFGPLDVSAVRVLLCDADGNLFPSEDHAFVASTEVTNRLLADHGVAHRFSPDELRRAASGRNFRGTALWLAGEHGFKLDPDELERRVAAERRQVMAHLAAVLEPDPAVGDPLRRLAERFSLAVVSSSALARLAVCFSAAGLDDLFAEAVRFSAEDSLPVPSSKPDPAIYAHAGDRLGLEGPDALAVEDAVPGVASAVAAGFACVGNVQFVGPGEREERAAALREAGAVAVVSSWAELEELLRPPAEPDAARGPAPERAAPAPP